jgi:hypothetical protein
LKNKLEIRHQLKVFAREKDRLIFKSTPDNFEVILLNSSGKWCSALNHLLVHLPLEFSSITSKFVRVDLKIRRSFSQANYFTWRSLRIFVSKSGFLLFLPF